MSIMQTFLVVGPALALMLCGAIPQAWANKEVLRLRNAVPWLVGFQSLVAGITLYAMLPHLLAGGSPQTVELFGSGVSLYLDGFSLLMLCLVSFVGFVVTRFSIRYLDGDPNQGSFFRWVALTLGAVSLFVISGHLLLLFGAWVLSSFGLHHLLVHYPHRKAAKRTAWTKFAISRLGDAMLLTAIGLIYRQFGSLELAEIFSALAAGTGQGAGTVTAAAWLVVWGLPRSQRNSHSTHGSPTPSRRPRPSRPSCTRAS